MTDNQLFAVLFSIVRTGLAARGVADVTVAQSFQPTQQGGDSGPAVYLTKLFDTPRGHPRRDTVYDTLNEVMNESEVQTYETTYQVNARSLQIAGDVAQLTASDLVKLVRQILQSSAVIALLNDSNLAILRISELRNPAIQSNDEGRFEFSPSFDFILTYDETYSLEVPAIETVEYNINRV
jgi:hypothetical protein